MERHQAAMLDVAPDCPPRHPLVWMLLGDLGVELARDTAHLGHPVAQRRVELAYLLHPIHELREGLELCPLVVGHRNGDLDVDGFNYLTHERYPCWSATSNALMRISLVPGPRTTCTLRRLVRASARGRTATSAAL